MSRAQHSAILFALFAILLALLGIAQHGKPVEPRCLAGSWALASLALGAWGSSLGDGHR